MLRFLTAGESHGPAICAILEGMPAGLPIAQEDIRPDLLRRQSGYGSGPRMKIESDAVQILGGVLAGETIGAPISLLIKNADHLHWKAKAIEPMSVPRPGHADLTGAVKYGYRDLRCSLERASARETVARVAIGALCRKLLGQFGIRVGSYVCQIGSVRADFTQIPIEERFKQAEQSAVRGPGAKADQAMQAEIRKAMQARDTLGGVFEVVAIGVPAGLGSYVHWDRRLDSRLSAALMSIPGIKGVEIGRGFENAALRGTEVQDQIYLQDNQLIRRSNNAGGLEGGISNGQPIIARAAMKPISTTLTPLASVDLVRREPAGTNYERSDFCAVPRAAIVGEAMVNFVLADVLLEKLGGDSMQELRLRFASLRHPHLDDLTLSDQSNMFWE